MAQSVDSTTCPEQLTTMSDLSNPNGNTRPQRKCTRSKRIYEDYEMTKISKPIKTMKRRRRQLKMPLLHVDNASYESERPSNVCVTQPNNSEENVKNDLDDIVTQPNNSEIYSLDDDDDDFNLLPPEQQNYLYMLLNQFHYIQIDEDNNIFPGYNEQFFRELKIFLLNQKASEFIFRAMGTCTFKDLCRVFVPGAWLNDTIIQQYFKLISIRSNDSIYIMDSFCFIDLEKHGNDAFKEICLKNADLLSYSEIFIPAHIDNHWALIVVEIGEKKIVCYDSLNYYDRIYPLMELLREFLHQKYFMQQENYTSNSSIIKLCLGDSPKQDNSTDCGIFTCINGAYKLYNKPLNYTQSDIPLFRQKIIYEMLCNHLFITE